MDFRQLRYFMEIARQGSLTKASEKLGITQPSLGYHVRRLEDELQLSLLVRGSRGVRLTAAGRILFEEGAVIVKSLDTLRDRLLEASTVIGGAVSIGLPPSLSARLLLPLIEQARIEHPSLKLSITEDLSKNLINMVETDQLDLALAYDVPDRADLILKKVESEPIGFAYATDGSKPASLVFEFKDIAQFPLVLQKKPHHMREVIERVALEQNVKLNIAFEMHSRPAVVQLVEHGLGGTISSLSAQSRLRREHRIIIRRFVKPSITAELFLVSLAARPLSKAQKAIATIVQGLLSVRSN